jgi:tripartite ATP-independent transporter DctM subunit
MAEVFALTTFLGIFALIMTGYPVAFVLAGASLMAATIGHMLGIFDLNYIAALPSRVYGIMTNDILLAIPLFIFMGMVLERSKIAEELLVAMSNLLGGVRSGLAISVMLVGTLLAASTGIVGATVVTMGLISLPIMLKKGYSPQVATGTICAAGTLGQVIPPSIVLILLGDQISNAYQNAQMQMGNFDSDPVSVADLFLGAIIPGLALVAVYIIWLLIRGEKPVKTERKESWGHIMKIMLPPMLLIFVVLGSILSGLATATESASVGAVGAVLLAYYRHEFCIKALQHVCMETAKASAMIFSILIAAAMFSLVFRGLGGDDIVHEFLTGLPGELFGAMFFSMLIIFILGFFLDFIEIIFIVVPIIAPILLVMGADPIWLAIMITMNLQTSFLTPPFGFALFYLRGVAPKSVRTADIYRGIIPFVGLQILMLSLIAAFPSIATSLPHAIMNQKQHKEVKLELKDINVIDW